MIYDIIELGTVVASSFLEWNVINIVLTASAMCLALQLLVKHKMFYWTGGILSLLLFWHLP